MFVSSLDVIDNECVKCMYTDDSQGCLKRSGVCRMYDGTTGYYNSVIPVEQDRLLGISEAGISPERACVLGTESALDTQVGGGHYKSMVIQPVEFCQKNHLDHCESSIVKYACRHKDKNGAEDVKKIIHYAQLILELTYGEIE